MPNLYSPDSRDYSKYDAMTTQELEQILDHYFLFPEDVQDKNLMVHIMEVLTERDIEVIDTNISNPNASWDDFLRAHPGIVGTSSKSINITTEPAKERTISRKSLRRAAGIAAVLICVLLGGTATAYATGIDVFGTIARWTDSNFSFAQQPGGTYGISQVEAESVVEHIPELLRSFYEELKSFDSMPLIPTYLPEGYVLDKVESYSDVREQTVRCLLTKESECIILNYTFHYTVLAFNKYEKDYGDPENIEISGATVYMFSNVDNYIATWLDGNTECSIIANSKTELEKIIESLH